MISISTVGLGASICLVDANSEIPISLANYLDTDFSLHKNQILGEVKPVVTDTDDLHSHDIDPEEKTDFSKVDLSHLSPQEQRQVSHLLDEYRDVFAQSQDDLGFCGILEHEKLTLALMPLSISHNIACPTKRKKLLRSRSSKCCEWESLSHASPPGTRL